MWYLVFAMLGILVLAGIVVLYVAFPHRGEDVPAAPWLSDVMRKGAGAVPILENTAEEPRAADDAFDLRRLGSGLATGAHASTDPPGSGALPGSLVREAHLIGWPHA